MLDYQLHQRDDHVCASFTAMASPCEILIETQQVDQAQHIAQLVCNEAKRIEAKFSRYRNDNIVYQINHASGQTVSLDAETANILAFAKQCFELSEGRFDITAGVLNRIWHFTCDAQPPSAKQITNMLPFVGFAKLDLGHRTVRLPEGMQIDLGGIGKEYAVDRAVTLTQKKFPGISVLVNFGGDLGVTKPRQKATFWQVGIEHPDPTQTLPLMVKIAHGGLATSGDARRFLIHKGVRYSHVLDPFTGKALTDAPRSITVAGQNCTQAGLLATVALLHGREARQFLVHQRVTHWVLD